MISQEKICLMTIKHQKIMLFMHGIRKRLVYKDQSIYKANGSFKRAMRQLKNAGFVNIRTPNGNHAFNEYSLSFDGIFLVEDILENFIRSNRKTE